MSQRITKDALKERIDGIVDDGNGTAEYYSEAISYLLHCAGKDLSVTQFEDQLLPILQNSIQTHQITASPLSLSHVSSAQKQFIQKFIKEHVNNKNTSQIAILFTINK